MLKALIDKEEVVKTKLSIAISAALLSTTAIADIENKYNTTNQSTNKYAGLSVTKNGKNEQKQAVAWMIKLTPPLLLSKAS